jgi:hypothetical protein
VNCCDAGWKKAWRGALMTGSLLWMVGCHARDTIQESRLYARIMQKNHGTAPGAMAAKARDTIAIECRHGSWANVSKGLIVTEPGTHEDVFSLRDRITLQPNAYPLDEAWRLVVLLRAEARTEGHTTEQAGCIQEFAEHLQTLTEQRAEIEAEQKDLDVSALNEAKKQAEGQQETVLPDPGRSTSH